MSLCLGCLKPPEKLPGTVTKSPPRREPVQALPPTAEDAAMMIGQLGGRVVRNEAGDVRYVVLTDLPVGDETLASIKTLEDVEVLGLSGTRVTNQGMTHLTGLKRLTYLFLNNTQVTDQGLLSLADNVALRYVSLGQTSVSSTAIEAFRKLSPGTLVHHSPPNAFDQSSPLSPNAPSLAHLETGLKQFSNTDNKDPSRSANSTGYTATNRSAPKVGPKDGNVVLRYRDESEATTNQFPSDR